MRIIVKGDGHNINIPIPTRMIFSKATVWMWLKFARKAMHSAEKYIPENAEYKAESLLESIPDKAVYALCDELLRIKRKHGSWDLVEVESSDGDTVRIFVE